MTNKKSFFIWTFVLLVLAAGGIAAYTLLMPKEMPHPTIIKSTATYKIDEKYDFKLETFESGIEQITRIRISPDGMYMFVATLPGKVWVYMKDSHGVFIKQAEPFLEINTGLEGLPRENGLTGFAFAVDYEKTKEIFVTYTAVDDNKNIRNRVARTTLREANGITTGVGTVVIFEGNVTPSQAHQIQNGVGVEINGKSHFMFTVGDAFNSTFAHDLTKDAGKVMLIQRDGTDPLGARPYPKNKKIQAVGLRNAYDLVQNPFAVEQRFLMTETGNEKNDKLVYGSFLSSNSSVAKPLDLLWDGTDGSQILVVTDSYQTKNLVNMNLYHWSPSVTPLDLQFYKGGIGKIEASTAENSYFLISLFGSTGSTRNEPGKAIMLGRLDNSSPQPQVELLPFISRSPAAEGKQGQPVGLAVDPITQDIYFGDIFESKIYKVSAGTNNTKDVTVTGTNNANVVDKTSSDTVEIAIKNFGYSPEAVVVKKGTTITWKNNDVIHHTVTSVSGSELDSELLNQGDSYSHQFNTVGTFGYLCTPHPFMKGTVTVID